MSEAHQLFALRRIKEMVCESFDVRMTNLTSERRGKEICMPRQIAYLLCRELTPASLPRIGRAFGNRHHTTIMSGITKAEELIREYPYIGKKAQQIKKDFRNEAAE